MNKVFEKFNLKVGYYEIVGHDSLSGPYLEDCGFGLHRVSNNDVIWGWSERYNDWLGYEQSF